MDLSSWNRKWEIIDLLVAVIVTLDLFYESTIINSYQCVLVVSALDSLPLLFVLQNAMGHYHPSLPFDFYFLFENTFKKVF